MKTLSVLALVLAGVFPAAAQTSAHYRLTESAFNSGGDPNNGKYAISAHHRVTLDALGDAIASSATLTSPSHRATAGFITAFPPPGEVISLWLLADRTTLQWTPEPSVGSYNLYRGLLTKIPGTFGACLQSRIAPPTWSDTDAPPGGNGFFYLVTARNRLAEEGPKGYSSSGAEEPNPAPCL